jgi:hypothetical protein
VKQRHRLTFDSTIVVAKQVDFMPMAQALGQMQNAQ